MKFPLLTLVAAFFVSQAAAQDLDLNNYTTLQSRGTVPADFTILSQDKAEADISAIDQNQSRSERAEQERFYRQSNYFVDDLLLSGKVLFNDQISDYVEKVGNKVLEHVPELQGKVRFYTIKSTVVNALATNQGIIFIDLGLIAQLENEAQLAYVLSHELIHYREKHVINAYVENSKIIKGQDAYQNTTFNERILAKSTYSKDLELEADREGLELFLKTDYDINSVMGVFDVLQYSYLPFDDIDFEVSMFETEHMKIPAELLLSETAEISGDEDWDDSKSTHPNIATRRENIEDLIAKHKGEEGEEFLISELEFLKVREFARFEMSRLYLLKRDYATSMYNTWMLMQQHKDNRYLEICMGKALHNLSTYKNAGLFTDVHWSYTDIEGKSQQLYFFLEQLTEEELNVLSVHWNWKLLEKYPDDPTVQTLADLSLKELVHSNEMRPDDYFDAPKVAEVDSTDFIDTTKVDYNSLSKYEKIKLQRQQQAMSEDPEEQQDSDNFIRFAFIDLLNSEEFRAAFDKHVEEYENEPEYDYKRIAWERDQERKRQKRIRKHGRGLAIDTIVLVDPFYKKVDTRKEDAVRFEKSEAAQGDLVDLMVDCAEMQGLEMMVLDSKDLNPDAVEAFNDMALLQDWLNERLSHENLDAVVSDAELADKLIDKYGTEYFNWSGVVSLKEPNRNAAGSICAGIMIPIILPLMIYQAASPVQTTYYYSLVFNVRTGDAHMIEFQKTKLKDSNDFLKVHVYDSINQIKSERTK